jgi:transcription elongation GreA/GreB family factor
MGDGTADRSDDEVPKAERLTGHGCDLDRDPGGSVRVGSRVRLSDQYGEVALLIVSTERSDGSGTLSVHSPLGAALLHRRVGARLTVRTPFGFHFVAILSVDRADHAPEPGVDP